jgi:hypothetical protein
MGYWIKDADAYWCSMMLITTYAVRLSQPVCLLTSSQDTYGAAIETLEEVSKVVDSLYAKVGPRQIAYNLLLTPYYVIVGKDSIAYACICAFVYYLFFPHANTPCDNV